nr:MAG TPA: Helix-turn-helix XRE-family like protein [Inoviridae sp.]
MIYMNYPRIRDLKEDRDMKQSDIAKIINMSDKQYARYERGETDVPLQVAITLADFYNVSLDYIAGRTNDKRGLTRSELSDEETELIKKYRSLSEGGRNRILERMDVISEQEQEQQAKIKGVG